MLPLPIVGRSNFVTVCVNLTTLIKKKRNVLMRTAVLYIYIYLVGEFQMGFKNVAFLPSLFCTHFMKIDVEVKACGQPHVVLLCMG